MLPLVRPEEDLLPAPTRDQISRLEAEMRSIEQIDIPTDHVFCKGLYARQITIPAGAVLVGKVHKTEHLVIVSKGRIRVATEDGHKELSAPCMFSARPGTKRVGVALEETVFINVHANPDDVRDLETLEAIFIEPEQLPFEARELIA